MDPIPATGDTGQQENTTQQLMETTDTSTTIEVPQMPEPAKMDPGMKADLNQIYLRSVVHTPEPAQQAINLTDSGFLEEVVHREYAEKPQGPVLETKEPVPPPAPTIKPRILGQGIMVKTDDVFQKINNPEAEPVVPPIPSMEYLPPLPDAPTPGIGETIGSEVGQTTSEWAFGVLENFYPDIVQFFTKVDSTFVEKAKLPVDLEAELIRKIIRQNDKIKDRVRISDFHKKNILPPLKNILAKKGWESVIPDEVMLIAGLAMLAADTFLKVNEIRKENRLLQNEIKQSIQKYIDIRTEQEKKIEDLSSQLAEMRAMMQQIAKNQPAAA